MAHPAQQIVFQEYINTVTTCCNRVQRLTDQDRHQSRQRPQNELIEALQSMRGISLIVAPTIVAELGDLTRFENPGKLMAFLGLISFEHSNGERVSKGSITKTGNMYVSKALVRQLMPIGFRPEKAA